MSRTPRARLGLGRWWPWGQSCSTQGCCEPATRARSGCFAKPTPPAGNAPPTSPNQVRTTKLRRSHWQHDISRRSNATALEIKCGSGRTGGTQPRQWGQAGLLGTGLRAGVRQDPRSLGMDDVESLAALKQALQPAPVRVGSSAPSAEASLGRAAMPGCSPGWQEGIFQVLPPAGPSAQRKRGHPGPAMPPAASLFEGGDKARSQILCFSSKGEGSAQPRVTHLWGMGRAASPARLSLREVTTETTNNS